MMVTRPRAPLRRDPAAAEGCRYDVIVLGGGINGTMVALEAARRGLSCLLLEAGDFGGQASWASLRILHGGLRALQSLDISGAAAAAREQLWFQRHFADLVAPLPCLLPLYGVGLRRPALLRVGLAAHAVLRRAVAGGAGQPDALPAGRVLSPRATVELYPMVERADLAGAALWHDLRMLSSERIIIESLRWAAALDATVLNYVRAERIDTVDGMAVVAGTDMISGAALRFEGRSVVEAIGPGPGLPRAGAPPAPIPGMLAFNLLLDRPPETEVALGVTGRSRGARTFFLLPWGGTTLAGTFHAPQSGLPLAAAVTKELASAALRELAEAAPRLGLGAARILAIYPGWLPARQAGAAEPARNDTVQGKTGGGAAPGLARIGGVKFTMARRVATQTVDVLFPRSVRNVDEKRRAAADVDGRRAVAECRTVDRADAAAGLRDVVEDEAVMLPADLVLRRVDSVGTLAGRPELERLARAIAPARSAP